MTFFRNICLTGALVLSSVPACLGVTLPAGTELEVRLLHGVGTRQSHIGDRVEAVVIAPVSDQGQTVIPAGATVAGLVEDKDTLGFGLRHTAARLDLHFRELYLPDGSIAPLDGHVVAVETARETVRMPGSVIGIHPTASVSSGVSFAFTVLFFGEPEIRVLVVTFKVLAARSPDAEILFPAGTEMRLRLTNDVELDGLPDVSQGLPMLNASEISRSQDLLAELPRQQATRGNEHPSDLVNIMITGTRDEVERAFRAAGWHTAEHHGLLALYHMYHCTVERMGNSAAPMSSLKLNGRLQDISFEKSLDTFAKRHHIRLWQDPKSGVWLGAATEDVGYAVSQLRLTHASDRRIDNERAKVVNDLAFTGCVAKGALIPRSGLKPVEDTGHPILTDGDIAVLDLNSCEHANGMPSDPPKPPEIRAIKMARAVLEDLVRSNPVTIGYAMTKSFLERPNVQASARVEASRTFIRPVALTTVGVKRRDSVLATR